MEIPVFQYQQPGATYYYSPWSIYNLGMVDQAHNNGDDKFKVHFLNESLLAVYNAEKFLIGKGTAS